MDKLAELRKQLKAHGVDAFVQPLHDEFMSEYPPACNQRIAFLTGFSGSAGTVVVAADKAAFLTDGRYTLQAAKQVDSKSYALLDSGVSSPEKWLAEHLQPGQMVGYDAKLHSPASLKRMQGVLAKKNITLKSVPNLIDAIWKDRPAAPASKLFAHDIKYSGEDAASKRARIAAKIKEEGADALILTTPESVCWLLNVRGADVECTPVALVTAILKADGKGALYIDSTRVDTATKKHLGDDINLRGSDMGECIKKLCAGGTKVMLDPASASSWFFEQVTNAGGQVVEAVDPCILPKAYKNATEIASIRAAHIRDGAAIVRLLHWLDTKEGSVTEIEVADKLLGFRAEDTLFTEPSFPTIAGSGANGAIVHYRADEQSNRMLQKGELFLLDSGGQYHDGTTDITRTVAYGAPTVEHKDRFTRVLKGHIAIATARFPEGTAGSQLDALARHALWQVGLDYEHGTGHGVGQFLGVHEGPQRISKRGGDVALKAGMVVSNEPGYYKAGEYGIRIENLVTVVEKEKGENKPYFGFDTITCAPIDRRLVETSLLTVDEKIWLNGYHAWVLSELSPLLNEQQRAWLSQCCAAI